MKQLTIQEWFARAVASGIMPEWKNIYARRSGEDAYLTDMDNNHCENLFPHKVMLIHNVCITEKEIILRQNNKDLYSLEWRKPTKSDIGKMCWFKNGKEITYAKLDEIDRQYFYSGKQSPSLTRCLIADHPFPPTEEVFKQVYGE